MAKTFLRRGTVISIEKLKEFGLSQKDINEIKSWEKSDLKFSGIIIDTDDDRQRSCYPYEKTEKIFLKDHPEGIIW